MGPAFSAGQLFESGVSGVILLSSLCAGRWRYPLNLFGMILVWKRIGEQARGNSGLDWTVIRPGGLSEREETPEDEALNIPASIGRILEVTSSASQPKISLSVALLSIDP